MIQSDSSPLAQPSSRARGFATVCISLCVLLGGAQLAVTQLHVSRCTAASDGTQLAVTPPRLGGLKLNQSFHMIGDMPACHGRDLGRLAFAHIPKNAGSSFALLGNQLLERTGRGWGEARARIVTAQQRREDTFWGCVGKPGWSRCRDPEMAYNQVLPGETSEACLAGTRWQAEDFIKPRCTEYHLPPWRRPGYYANREVFCVVRAPEARVVSEYRYLHSVAHWLDAFATFSPFKRSTPCSKAHLNAWITGSFLPEASRGAYDCHGLPQVEYFRGGGCTVVLRTERLTSDFAKFASCYGLNETQLPHANAAAATCGLGVDDLEPQTLQQKMTFGVCVRPSGTELL